MTTIASKPLRIDSVSASGADMNQAIPYVLVISLTMTSSLMALAWIVPALYG